MPINKTTLVLAGVGTLILSVMVAFILIINPRYTQSGIAVNTLEARQQPTSEVTEEEEATAEFTSETEPVESTEETTPTPPVPDEDETPEAQPTPTSRSRVPGSVTLGDDMTNTPSE